MLSANLTALTFHESSSTFLDYENNFVTKIANTARIKQIHRVTTVHRLNCLTTAAP